MTPSPTPPAGRNVGRIIGIVLLAGVALCGILGTCLLVLNLVLTPLMVQ